MFFLFNTVVVKTQFRLELPPGLEQLSLMSPAMVLNAGRELYAARPRLEYEDVETVRWYCTLLQQKFPKADAVRFQLFKNGCTAELTAAPLPEMVRLWKAQSSGQVIAPDVHALWLGGHVVA